MECLEGRTSKLKSLQIYKKGPMNFRMANSIFKISYFTERESGIVNWQENHKRRAGKSNDN